MTSDFAQRETSRQANISRKGPEGDNRLVRQWLMTDSSYSAHAFLRPWRKYHGLTLERLANIIDSKPNTISGWETGNRVLDLEDLEKIAKAYGVHPSVLLLEPPGTSEFERLRRAGEILKKMPAAQGDKWLEFGEASIAEPAVAGK